jgi:predicted ATPase
MPLVIFMDDMQWADSATLDLLQYAIRRWRENAARIMLLVSVRTEALHPMIRPRQVDLIEWLEHVSREIAPLHLELEPLAEPDTVHMVLSILASPAADFARWVFHETHGQPFYLMETLKDLLERGALRPKRQAEGAWAFEVDAEHDLGKSVRVPSTVWAVIRSRVHRLSPNAVTLLVAGAVLDQRMTFQRLCAISNITEDAGLPALDELISNRLLLEVTWPGTTGAYAFANDMIRDVVYTEAGDARRRLFHRRALEILEAAGDSATVLAHHALAAGLTDTAFRHSVKAGQEALDLVATGDAIVHFEKARQLVLEGTLIGAEFAPLKRDLYLALAQAYDQRGLHEQALAVYAEMERVAPE